MKATSIKKLKDGSIFQLSKRSRVQYELVRKWKDKGKNMATFTSTGSDRSFIKPLDTTVYV